MCNCHVKSFHEIGTVSSIMMELTRAQSRNQHKSMAELFIYIVHPFHSEHKRMPDNSEFFKLLKEHNAK